MHTGPVRGTGVPPTTAKHHCAHQVAVWQGWNILADPTFAEQCFPVNFVGPKRYTASPIRAEGLPQIDIVMISNNQYDHLDAETVAALATSPQGIGALFFVPLGLKEWFAQQGIRNAVEMDWSEAS